MTHDVEFDTKRFSFAYFTCENLYYDNFKMRFVCADRDRATSEPVRMCIHCRKRLHGEISEKALNGTVIDNV